MKVLYCLTHPIQYQSPLVRYLDAGGLDIEVVYASDANSRAFFDQGFGQRIAWDVPLLEGYRHEVLNAEEPRGSEASQVVHYEAQLSRVIAAKQPKALWVHGWAHPFTKAAWRCARRHSVPLLLRGETFLGCVRGGLLRRWAHRWVLSRKFCDVAACLAVGSLNRELYRAYGVADERVFSMPYVVDNDFFKARATEAHPQRETLRASLGLRPQDVAILFCGKLIAVKSPALLLRAVAELQATGLSLEGDGRVVVLFAGDGELRSALETQAQSMAEGSVRFLGFKNQTELPALYDACDVFALPSGFEPWGLVVNEVMCAGKPVIVSDAVGSGPDLVQPGVNGDIFRAGDARDLAAKLRPFLASHSLREQAGAASLQRIEHWGFAECLAGVKAAFNSL